MNIRKGILRLIARGAVLVGALVALTLFINLSWFDEPLHPDLASLKTPEPVSMTGNSYPLIYGLPAADDKDSRSAGEAIVRKLRGRFERGERVGLGAEEMSDVLGGSGFDEAWQAHFESLGCNWRSEPGCADRLVVEVGRTGSVPPRLRVLLDRYEDILRESRFEENQEFDAYTNVPAYGLLMRVARIRLAMSYQREPTSEVLDKVAEDLDFWRTMLRDGQSLISKMVALAGIGNDLDFLSTLIRHRGLDSEAIRSIRGFLQPFTREEQDIGEAFRAEMRIVLLSAKPQVLLPSDPSIVTRLLLQEQATMNEYYRAMVVPLELRASLDPDEFYNQRAFEPLTYDVRAFPPPLYNLGGKLVLKRMAREFSMQDYIGRVHDVNGRILLVLLQTEIEAAPDSSVEAVVRSSSSKNPYTLEPMDYDRQAGTIGFECLGGNPNDLCSVVVGHRQE